MTGKLIVFEGPDGTGKSVQWENTLTYLFGRCSAVGRRGPGQPSIPLCADVRELLFKRPYSSGLNGTQQGLLFTLDWVTLSDDIEDVLRCGTHVICDRWTPISQPAYDLVRKQPDARVTALCRELASTRRNPDAVIMIDVPAITAYRRAMARQGKTVSQNDKQWNGLEQSMLLHSHYHDVANHDTSSRWYVVTPAEDDDAQTIFKRDIVPILAEQLNL